MSNIVIICVDSLRRDRLAYYGYPIKTTAFLDRYFADSYKFNAISPSTWTPTVMASIFSSLYPWEHRVLRDKQGQLVERYNVSSSALLLFKDYYKVCFTSNPWLHPMFNLTKDFDEIKYISTSWDARDLNQALFETVKSIEGRRNLIFLHYMDVHEPYDLTFKDKIDVDLLKQIHGEDSKQSTIESRGGCKWTSLEENLYYNAAILKADYYIYEALKVLDNAGILEDSVTVLFSDHGEDLRDHGRVSFPRHAHSLYNELIVVPLMVRTNKKIEFDINNFVETRKLFYFLYGIVHEENIYQEEEIYSYVAYEEKMGSIFDPFSGLKYIFHFSSRTQELYDLKKDWTERENLAGGVDMSSMHSKLEDKINSYKRRRVPTLLTKDVEKDRVELSIVMANRNSMEDLEVCLHSIYDNAEELRFEIIVIDNASADGSIGMIENNFPAVRLIKNKKDSGLVAANNQGIRESQGKYILFLNPHVIIRPKALQNMVDYASQHPESGVIGCIIQTPDRSTQRYYNRLMTLSVLFFQITKIGRLAAHKPLFRKYSGYYDEKDIDPSHTTEVDQPSANCYLLPKALLQKIGSFDEFTSYFAHADLCKRILNAGYKINVIPDAKVILLKRESGKDLMRYEMVNIFREEVYAYAKKHFGISAVSIVKLLIWLEMINPVPESELSSRIISEMIEERNGYSEEESEQSCDEEHERIKDKLKKLGYF